MSVAVSRSGPSSSFIVRSVQCAVYGVLNLRTTTAVARCFCLSQMRLPVLPDSRDLFEISVERRDVVKMAV